MSTNTKALTFVIKSASQTFVNGFLKAFSIRAAIGVLSRIIELLRKNPKELLSFSNILGEKHLIFRVEAIRLGLFIGSFSGIYHLVSLLLKSRKNTNNKLKNSEENKINSFLAGSIAGGISICFLPKETRKTLALYAVARSLQSTTYSLAEKGYWDSLFSNKIVKYIFTKHSDALLFIISSAQIMYCYVMRPHTLPSSYWNFIVKTGPIPAKVLEAARHAADGNYPIPLSKLGFISLFSISPFNTTNKLFVLLKKQFHQAN